MIESNIVSGRKRRRKRTKPALSEADMNVLKRKPTTPMKPPVSKKLRVAEFSKRPYKLVELPSFEWVNDESSRVWVGNERVKTYLPLLP